MSSSKQRALKAMPHAARKRVDALSSAGSLETQVREIQQQMMADDRIHWLGEEGDDDGHPGNKFYCGLWVLMPPTVYEILIRIGLILGKDFNYKLGAGNKDWFLDDVMGRLDCSGGVGFTLMRDRGGHPDFIRPSDGAKWHLSTDSIYYDAAGTQQLFARCDGTQVPFIVVYPDKDGKQGHVAWVVEIMPDGTWWGVDVGYTISKKTGDATHLRDLSHFKRKVIQRRALVCRPVWWD